MGKGRRAQQPLLPEGKAHSEKDGCNFLQTIPVMLAIAGRQPLKCAEPGPNKGSYSTTSTIGRTGRKAGEALRVDALKWEAHTEI